MYQNLNTETKNRVTMEIMTRNKQKATLYTLQRSNETWKQNSWWTATEENEDGGVRAEDKN